MPTDRKLRFVDCNKPFWRKLMFVDCNKPFWKKLMYKAFVRAKCGCDKWHIMR